MVHKKHKQQKESTRIISIFLFLVFCIAMLTSLVFVIRQLSLGAFSRDTVSIFFIKLLAVGFSFYPIPKLWKRINTNKGRSGEV